MHDIDEILWTPKRVGDELVKAIRWSGSAVIKPGPGSASNKVFAKLAALVDEPTERPGRSYSPQQVARFERVIEWPMKYLGDLYTRDPEAIWVFKLWIECKITKGMTFIETVDGIGLSRATAYRYRDSVLSIIAQGLTADGIERGRH